MDVGRGADTGAAPRQAVGPPPQDIALASRQLFADIRDLPGVTRVFDGSSGFARWFDVPVTFVLADGPSARAWATIGVDRHHAAGGTVGLVAQYLRARLVEHGFDYVEVRVRVAVFE